MLAARSLQLSELLVCGREGAWFRKPLRQLDRFTNRNHTFVVTALPIANIRQL